MESEIYEKFKAFFDSALFGITETNNDYIAFNYPNYYDTSEFEKTIQREFQFIKSRVLPFIRNVKGFKGSIWIADYVYEK